MQEKAKQIVVDYFNSQNIKHHEITHNGDKNETYVDVYKKWENFVK